MALKTDQAQMSGLPTRLFLCTFVQVMCKEAGIEEKKTNHSLRATGASAMFTANVPEKMIREVTGHRSKALMAYERPSVEQRQAVSSVLMSVQDQENQAPPVAACKATSVQHQGPKSRGASGCWEQCFLG